MANALYIEKKINIDPSVKASDVFLTLEKDLTTNKVQIKERNKNSIVFHDVNFAIGFNFWKGIKGEVSYDKENNQLLSQTNHPIQALIGIVVMSLLIYIHKSPMVMYASFGLVILHELLKYRYFIQYLKNIAAPKK